MFLYLSIITSVIIILSLSYWLSVTIRSQKRLQKHIEILKDQLHTETNNTTQLELELHQLETEMANTFFRDPLTELPSRQLFEDRLKQVFYESKRYQLTFGILFVDIDNLEVINAALGYDMGDALIKEVGKRLLESIRKVDTVSRFNGTVFALILPQLSKPEGAAFVAQRLLEIAAEPFLIRNQELFITTSIGIAIYPSDGDEMALLIKNVDNALHQAKSRGRNTYQFYQQEMFQRSKRELLLNASLHKASIFQDFTIFYQPQVEIKSKNIIGLEALLRWQHPDFGLITPQEFIRLAENSGKIIPIGEWVLRNACEQFLRFQSQGLTLEFIAVNISFRQLENPHFIHKLSQLLHELRFKPEHLILEMTEGTLLRKLDLVEKTLHMLKHLGVQIAIDDFGTGNLALQHLRTFPIDYLKIDNSLTQDITVNQESQALTQMIIALGKTLHLGVIAEGVETAKQKELLHQLGVEVMQGHLFSVPRQAEEFTEDVTQSIKENV